MSQLLNLVLDAANPSLGTLLLFSYTVAMVSKLQAQQWLPQLSHAKPEKNSPSEIAVLTEKVEENLSVIQSKLTNSITNKEKN